MSQQISQAAAEKNEGILARVEELGGGYVWDAEVFAVTLMDVAIPDVEARELVGLAGVSQIAMNASHVSTDTLAKIAAIPGLRSLVLCNPTGDPCQMESLRSIGPAVEVVSE
jgi:hypothetical protein